LHLEVLDVRHVRPSSCGQAPDSVGKEIMQNRTSSILVGATSFGVIKLLMALAMSACVGCGEDESAETCTKEVGPYFSTLPIADERIAEVIVLGQFNPPGDVFPRSQTGFRVTEGEASEVFAAGDLLLFSVASTEYLVSPGRQGEIDYKLAFLVNDCRQIHIVYAHLVTLSPALSAAFGNVQCEQYSTDIETVETCSAFVREKNILISEGTVLGTAGANGWGLDFDAYDMRVEHEYISPQRPPSKYLNAICTTDLFVSELRTSLEARVGRAGVQRTANPVCGTMEVDVAGTAQGMWVVDGQDVSLDGETARLFFALADDDVQPEEYAVIATGHADFDYLDIGAMLYGFQKAETGRVNRDFDDLTPSGDIYCYEPATDSPLHIPADSASFFVALQPNGKLKIEMVDHSPEQSPCMLAPETWAFSGNEVTLMR
jgi:hypothetical protein